MRNGLFGGLFGRNVGQDQPTNVGSSAADSQSRSFTNNLRVGRLFGVTNTGSAASSNAISADGIDNTVNSKSLSSSVNLVGIPITNTMSSTRTTSNIDGGTTGSISDHFGIGKVGLTSTFSKDKIGSGLGVTRDPHGGLDVHIGAFNFDFSKNNGQQVATSAQATSETQAQATGLKAESDTQSESSSKGINLGLIGLTSSRTKTTSHASAIDGTASTGVASNANIVQEQTTGQFRPFGGFFRNMGNRFIQNFRPTGTIGADKNIQHAISNQQQYEHNQFQYEHNDLNGNNIDQQNSFIPNQFASNQQPFYQPSHQYIPYQQPIYSPLGQPSYQPTNQLGYPSNVQPILPQNSQQFDLSNQPFAGQQPFPAPFNTVPQQPEVKSQGQRMPQLSPSQEEDLYAIFNQQNPQSPETTSGIIRGPIIKNGPTANDLFNNIGKDFGSKSDERKVRDNFEEAGGDYNLDVRSDDDSQKRNKRQLDPLLDKIGETLEGQFGSVNDVIKKVSAGLANTFGVSGHGRQPPEFDQYHYHNHHPHGDYHQHHSHDHGDYHHHDHGDYPHHGHGDYNHHHYYPHHPYYDYSPDYFVDKPPPPYENCICPDGIHPYWNYPHQHNGNKSPPPILNSQGQNIPSRPPLPILNSNHGQKLPSPNLSNTNSNSQIPDTHKIEEEIVPNLPTTTFLPPTAIADNNVKDPIYDIDIRGDFNDRRRKREIISGQTETKQEDFVFKEDESEIAAKSEADAGVTKAVENSEVTEAEEPTGDEEGGELDSRFGLIGGNHRPGPIRKFFGGIVHTIVDEFTGRHEGISRPPSPPTIPNGYDQYQFGNVQQPPIGVGPGFPNSGFNHAQQPPILNGPGFSNPGLYPQQPPIGIGPSFPNQGFPGQGFPNQGFPNQGFPGQGFPNQGFPNQGFPNQGFPNQGFPNQAIQPIIPNQFGSASSAESNAQSSFIQGIDGSFVESNAGSNTESFVGPGGISGSQSSSHASSIGKGGIAGGTGSFSSATSGAFGGNVGGFGGPFSGPFFGLRSGEDDAVEKTEVEVEKKETDEEETFVFE